MGAFVSYPAIVAGLTSLGTHNRPEAFFYNGDLYMITGVFNTPIKGYKWNVDTSAWETNALFEAFDTNPGNAQIPCVFYYNNDLYLLSGSNYISTLKGFKWSVVNSRWETNAEIITGVSLTSTYLSPTVFDIGVDMYLINGRQDGTFNGYKWNGTQWEVNAGIIVGLPDVGSLARPESFYYNGDLYLHHSLTYNWKWNSNTLQWDASSLSGGSSARNTVFQKDGYTFLIVGGTGGAWTGYRMQPTAKLSSITTEPGVNIKAKMVINLSGPLEPGETLDVYNAPSAIGLGNPDYLVIPTQVDPVTFEYQTNIAEGKDCYFRANEMWNSTQIATSQVSGVAYWILPVMEETILNITDPNNYRTLDNPTHNYNHGSLYYNGFVYGSARTPQGGDSDIFKIEAADYSNLTQKTIYRNKISSLDRLSSFDQIIYCKGYLWVHRDQYLVRINLTDLDYMIFSGLPTATSEPLCADEDYIYLTGGLSATKIDASLLVDTFASYGYDGSAVVAVPAIAIISSCLFLQNHPTIIAYCHSAIVDAQYLYTAMTSVSITSGYDDALGINICHLQKIRKSDMVTVGDVAIPRSTDDMVQNADYVFLAPELGAGGIKTYQLGYSWGLFAIKKQTLAIKYLKALTPQQINSGTSNACFGVFEYGNKIVVQKSNEAKTIVIDISDIESWGENMPVGGATEKILRFQLNGVNIGIPCNELKVDNAGLAHTNTWDSPTLVFKFSSSILGFEDLIPTVQSVLIQSLINSTTIGGSILSPGSSDVTMVALRYGTASNNLDQIISFENPSINFQSVLNLTPGIYYFQAYAANSVGTSYGSIVPFVVGNTVILSHDSAGAAVALRNNNSGHAVRFCKRAWGVADGTIGSATDASGNTYKTVVINEIEWAAADLKTALYNNEDVIPEIQDNTAWSTTTDGARTYYNNILPT